MLDAAARSKGGKAAAAARRATKAVRNVEASQVPDGKPPETLDDAITWASWLAFAAVTGLLDPASVREANRSLSTLKDSISKRDLLNRIKVLERALAKFEKERRP